jgi:hypothetical protein
MSGWGSVIHGPVAKRQKTLAECGVDVVPLITSRPDYITVPTPLLAPAVVRRGLSAQLVAGALWSVPVAALPAGDLEAHCAALTCIPNKHKADSGFGPPKPFYIGFTQGDTFMMPPHYAAAAFPDLVPVNTCTDGEAMRPEAVFSGSLWTSYPPQQQAVNAWQAWQEANNSKPCMLSLPCGHGKSVICLAIASLKVRRVTLILMHMKGLVDQWIVEAKRYIPGARVGYVKADKQRVEGVDIIIASVQALHSHIQNGKPYLARLFERTGFVILDEAHHGVANTFQQVIAHVPAARRLAVTATPRRQDGLFEQLQHIFGPVVFRSFRRKGDGQVVMLKYTNPVLGERRKWGKLRKDLMETDLISDRQRTQLGVGIAVHLVTSQQRRVLILTSQVVHVHELAAKVKASLVLEGAARSVRLFVADPSPRKRRRKKNETEEAAAAAAEEEQQAWEDSGPHGHYENFDAPHVSVITSDMSSFERQLNYEAYVVVATNDIMKEGISYNDWDTLLDMDDGMDPEQMVGRIQRVGDKKVPLVIDMYTPVSLYNGMKEKRREFYLSQEFDVHYEHADVSGSPSVNLEFWEQFNRKAVSVL